MTLVSVSLMIFARLEVDSSWWQLLPGMMLGGFGMAITMTPMTAAAVGAAPVAKAGIASGVLNTSRQVGLAFGIAIMGAILSASQSDALAGGAAPSAAFVSGLQDAMHAGATLRPQRGGRRRTHDPAPAPRASRGGTRGGSMTTAARPRLTAPDRRAVIVDAALKVFSARSYRGATTAEISREAGVTEPVLYRHFASKRKLFLACVDEGVASPPGRRRGGVSPAEPDPAAWALAVPRAIATLRRCGLAPTQLWLQALGEATEDPEIRRYFRRHVRDVHDYVADVLRRAQEAGGIRADRDVEAEAWIGIGIGLLRSVQDRFGGVLGEEEAEAVLTARARWLTGRG